MGSLKRFLESRLKLRINQEKSRVSRQIRQPFLASPSGEPKQWRWAKTKVHELRKLGTSLPAAISVAISRKGPRHLSRTLAMQAGMTNQWLKDQGLLSVKELWVHIHYPAKAS
jgi:hypothetical protein